MQRLPATVRSALLSDAAPASQENLKRWTMRKLANINVTAAPPSSSATDPPSSSPSFHYPKRRKEPPRADVAEVLLKDIKLRLAGQLGRTLDMAQQAEAILGLSDDGGNSGNSSSNRHGGTENKKPSKPSQKPKVIRAINQPVRLSPKLQMEYEAQAQREKVTAMKNLKDIETLHTGTYSLVHDLLDDGAPTLRRYSAADASLVAATFESIRSRHAMSVELMADIVIALRRARSLRAGIGRTPAGQFCGIRLTLIDSFLRERLGIQLLCDHYVALDKGKPNGGIAVDCDLYEVVDDAVTEAKHVCDANRGVAPDVIISYGMEGMDSLPLKLCSLVGDSLRIGGYDGITLTIIRPWLHHALVEVLKNALSSSVQRADDSGDGSNPSEVHVRIVDGTSSISIAVLDQGVGLSEDGMKRAFRFAESSSLKRWDRIDEQTSYAMVRQPLGSLGVGLPLSRMMMEMFGGDVLISNRGKGDGLASGCTAVIKIPKDDQILQLTSGLYR